jgi:hypothetical protein
MPTFRVTAPDGKTYNVTPPEGTNPSQEEILRQVQALHGGGQPAPAPSAQGGPETFTPPDADKYGFADIGDQRREMVNRHGILPHEQAPAPRAAQVTPTSPQAASRPRMDLAARAGSNVVDTALGLPGVPIDLMVGGGNFLRRQFDLPEAPTGPGTPAYDWGGAGWRDTLKRNMHDPSDPTGKTTFADFEYAPPAETTAERLVDKAAQFATGGVLAGPAAMVPTATAFAGSEAGRALDQVAPEFTKGYGEFAGGVVGGAAGARRPNAVADGPAPSNAKLRSMAQDAYKRADDAGIIIKPEAMQNTLAELKRELADFGYHDQLHPGGKVGLAELESAANGGNITLKGVDLVRQVVKDAAAPMNWKDAKVTGKIVKRIDDMLAKLTPDDVVMGDVQGGVKALKEARDYWARLRKSEIVDEALDRAGRQTSRANSGGNIDNAIRQQFDRILNSASKRRGFSADELDMIRTVVKGRGNTQEFMRWVGKLSPRSGGLMSLLTAGMGGSALAAPVTAPMLAFPVAGAIARPIADAMTKGNVRMLSRAVRSGKTQAPMLRGPIRMLTRPPMKP